jgi:hypothetical protein
MRHLLRYPVYHYITTLITPLCFGCIVLPALLVSTFPARYLDSFLLMMIMMIDVPLLFKTDFAARIHMNEQLDVPLGFSLASFRIKI